MIDHLLLLARQRWPPRDRNRDRVIARTRRGPTGRLGGAVDELLLAREQLRSGVAQFLASERHQAPVGSAEGLGVGQQRDRSRRRQEPVSGSFDQPRVGHRADREPLAKGLNDIAAIKAPLRLGQPADDASTSKSRSQSTATSRARARPRTIESRPSSKPSSAARVRHSAASSSGPIARFLRQVASAAASLARAPEAEPPPDLAIAQPLRSQLPDRVLRHLGQAEAPWHLRISRVGQRVADSLGWCGGGLRPPGRSVHSNALANERRSASDRCNAFLRARRPLGQLQLRIFKDAGSHLRHRVEQAARLQRLAVLRL